MPSKHINSKNKIKRTAIQQAPSKPKFIVGIDEVGRGPLAGPVTVAAVALSKNFQFSIFNFQKKNNIKLKDSKKLTPIQREVWFKYIKKQKIPYAICNISPQQIDKINISKAANLAATKALSKLTTNNPQLTTKNSKIFLDGGLKLHVSCLKFHPTTIIKGDEKIPAISLASIIAKVTRDKYMRKMHKKYPRYEFNSHKGYGTKKHIRHLKNNGHCFIHRHTFLKNIL